MTTLGEAAFAMSANLAKGRIGMGQGIATIFDGSNLAFSLRSAEGRTMDVPVIIDLYR